MRQISLSCLTRMLVHLCFPFEVTAVLLKCEVKARMQDWFCVERSCAVPGSRIHVINSPRLGEMATLITPRALLARHDGRKKSPPPAVQSFPGLAEKFQADTPAAIHNSLPRRGGDTERYNMVGTGSADDS